MKMNLTIGSVISVAFLLFASMSSVIGYTAAQRTVNPDDSPLFAIQNARSTQRKTLQELHVNYLGKGRSVDLSFSSRLTLQSQLEKALTLLNTNPALLQVLLAKVTSAPNILVLLQERGIDLAQITQFVNKIRENPELIKNLIGRVQDPLLCSNDPRPLGLDTSNLLSCIIDRIVLLPIAIAIGMVIATAMIITCLNIGGCFADIIKAIFSQLVQGMDQPLITP